MIELCALFPTAPVGARASSLLPSELRPLAAAAAERFRFPKKVSEKKLRASKDRDAVFEAEDGEDGTHFIPQLCQDGLRTVDCTCSPGRTSSQRRANHWEKSRARCPSDGLRPDGRQLPLRRSTPSTFRSHAKLAQPHCF